MLKRSSRLTTRQFNEVMKTGRVSHSPFFIVRVLNPGDAARIAAVAPQKIAKTAVARNKARRRIYSALEGIRDRIIPAHIILIAKPPFFKADSVAVVATDIEGAFVKAGLLR